MNFDWTILQWIQENLRCTALDFLMPKITMLGNSGMIWIAIALVMLCTKKYRKHGIILLVGLLIGLLVGNVCLKNLVARARPCWIDPGVPLLIGNPTDYSFPSGHTLSSVIAATILYDTDKRFGIPAIILAVLIAFSRLYLYVHFPTDVLAAALLGVLIGKLLHRWHDECGAGPHIKTNIE